MMRTGGISTFAQTYMQRLSLQRAQSEMNASQGELASGKVAEVSRRLGPHTGQYLAIEMRIASLESNIASNAMTTGRLEATNQALDGLQTNLLRMQEVLINGRNGSASPRMLVEQSRQLLADISTKLNSTFDGAYLFSGVNSQNPAIKDLLAPSGAAQIAVEQSFVNTFGFGRNDPAVATISASAMSNWLEHGLAAVFASSAWEESFSGASTEVPRARIDENQIIKTGASVSEPALRKIVMAYVIASSLGVDAVKAETLNAMVDKAIGLLGDATIGVNSIQSAIGTAKNRIDQANDNMKKKKDLFSLAAGEMVNRDPYELSIKINELKSRLEASYSVTSRMKDLSLLRYI